MKPLITVVIATHERPFLLKRAIQSVQAQNRADIQVIVVSDENSPESFLAVQPLLGALDLFICRRGQLGPGESRNVALDMAKGKFIVFLDDDDSFASGYFDALEPYLDEELTSILYVNPTFVNEQRFFQTVVLVKSVAMSIGDLSVDDIQVRNRIPNNCLIYPAAALKEVRYKNSLVLFEDWEFLLQLTKQWGVRHIPVFGPVIHKTDRGKGDRRSAMHDDQILSTLLAIYKMWPSASNAIQQARRAYLAAFGINLPLECF